jgi:16S rRNA (guanine(966)-N(2))-methyltransferase RsmD
MRITGGQASGRILNVPKGHDVRPTPDLVKQAVFNSLGERVVNARVLELFAGTGALSLESLSRGAAHAVCVEKAQRHALAIRRNLETSAFPADSLDVRVQDVFTALTQLAANGSQFDLVLADPPYGEKNVGHRSRSLAQRLLDDAHLPPLLAPGAVFVLGHTKRDTLEIPPVWHELKLLKHGDSLMRLLQRAV